MKVFIGADRREQKSLEVCRKSIERFNSRVEIQELHIHNVRDYERPYSVRGNQYIDGPTGQPFSTEFAFTRFMVPYLNRYKGWALFVDSDFVFKDDVMKVMDYADSSFPVMCVQHDWKPKNDLKMDKVIQRPYFRKLWSAFTLWNCGHPRNKALTPEAVNSRPGLWLHQFEWCKDEIAPLPEEWHWVLGKDGPISPTTHYRHAVDVKAYHYTEGTPEMPGYEDCYKSEEWLAYVD